METASIALQLPSKTSEKTSTKTKSSQTSRRKFILASIILLLVLVGGICGLLVYLHVIPFGSSSSSSSGELQAQSQGDYLFKPSGAEFEVHIDPAQSDNEVDVANSCRCSGKRINNCRTIYRCEKKWALYLSTRDSQLWYAWW